MPRLKPKVVVRPKVVLPHRHFHHGHQHVHPHVNSVHHHPHYLKLGPFFAIVFGVLVLLGAIGVIVYFVLQAKATSDVWTNRVNQAKEEDEEK